MGTKMKDEYRGFTVPCKVDVNEIRSALEQDPHWCPAEDNADPTTSVCHNVACRDCIYFNEPKNRYALECALEAGIFPEVDPETEDADLDALQTKDTAEHDPVNHPNHYCVGQLECIDVMELVFGTQMVMAFCRLNAFKYLFRSERKNGVQDIEKAHWYLGKYLQLHKKSPLAPMKSFDEDAARSAILRLLDMAQIEAKKDCEPTPAVWDAVDKLWKVLGIKDETGE